MEHMGLVVWVLHFETVTPRLDILIGGNPVTRNVDVSFDLGLLRRKVSLENRKDTVETGPDRRIVTPHPVEVTPFQHAIPVSPRVIVLPPLHQPAIEIGGPDLLQDATTLDEAGNFTRSRGDRRLWCVSGRTPFP